MSRMNTLSCGGKNRPILGAPPSLASSAIEGGSAATAAKVGGCLCEGFRMTAHRDGGSGAGAVVRKSGQGKSCNLRYYNRPLPLLDPSLAMESMALTGQA